jgi:predicted HTH domain antitoxin
MTEVVSTRVPEDMAKDLQEIVREEKTDRATVVRKLLAKAICDWKLERALTLYGDGRVTLWRAAAIAGLSLWEMIEVVRERKVPFQYVYDDFREDFEEALKERFCCSLIRAHAEPL